METKESVFTRSRGQTHREQPQAKTPKADPSPHYKPWGSHRCFIGSFRLNRYFEGSYFVLNLSITFMSSLNSSYDSKIS